MSRIVIACFMCALIPWTLACWFLLSYEDTRMIGFAGVGIGALLWGYPLANAAFFALIKLIGLFRFICMVCDLAFRKLRASL